MLPESLPEKHLALVEDFPVLAEGPAAEDPAAEDHAAGDLAAGDHPVLAEDYLAAGNHPDPACPDFPPSY